MVKITILNDTRNSRKDIYDNDDGFSAYIEVNDNKFLFDVGPNDNYIKNAKKMNIDLNKISTIVLSHGHFDHGDGLEFFNKKVKLIAHPNCTYKRWWKHDHTHNSGLKLSKAEMEKRFYTNFTKEPYQIFENVFFLGEIKRKMPVVLNKWALENGDNDEILDDSGITINTPNGIIVIAGCSHSGICNIVEYAKEVTGNNQVLAVLGGFHLRELGEETNKAIEYMRKNVKEVILAHCTVDEVCEKFMKELNKDIKISATEVGKEYIFNNEMK